jgi:hypothetical protein
VLTLGVDPDTVAPGLALADRERVRKIGNPSLPPDRHEALRLYIQQFIGASALMNLLAPIGTLVVEGQEIYRGSMANANDLLKVAHIAGAALSVGGFSKKILVLPKKWKGQQPKGVSQKATLEHYISKGQAWEYRDNGPDKTPTILAIPLDVVVVGEIQDWSEVLDAMGLALWGSKQP